MANRISAEVRKLILDDLVLIGCVISFWSSISLWSIASSEAAVLVFMTVAIFSCKTSR